MIGKNVTQHSFKRKEQVIPLSSKNAVKIKDDDIIIDQRLLLQRFVTVGSQNDNLAEELEYELCSYPPVLFENRITLRLSMKSALVDALWKLMPPDMLTPSSDIQYALDSGALLHTVD
ncbi:hypothetical protein Hamer_G007107 [Homarus americanus]|uniref:Uncharacterized protein n=1 Tax=Homarus americanus TaxID=6706 RepID=A0A8J5K2F5_HOMAM|nr:hypothetical protein Hamer_G007107 [Homarus americanus]